MESTLHDEKLSWKESKYCITMQLTSTACSAIYHAFNKETNEQLVVKHCLFREDFCREVAASVNIFSRGDNNYIVPIIDCFLEQNCLIMPYMEGGNLWNLRRKKKGFTPEQSFAVAAQVGLALQQVHAAGVIHNDVKSGNILLAEIYAESPLNRTPIVKLTDFGLSYDDPFDPGWSAGTPEYNAPEKITRSSKPTSAVDIYSLGLTLHEMLTDTLLYSGKIDMPREKIPPHEKIPEKILGVIRTACEIDPANRYKSAAEMISDLEKAVYGC